MSFKQHFARALGRPDAPLHVAAHSHHPWPDVTFAAQLRYWEDSARLLDRKWEHIFTDVVPAAQRRVASILGLSDPSTVVFGQNTHEFLLRILSCLPAGRTLRVLTTGAEFHSFRRQMARLEEDALVEVHQVPAEPFQTFPDRFAEAAGQGGWDLVWLSHVFFDSGYLVRDIEAMVAAVPDPETFVVIDGYHSFMALPVDLGSIAGRAFYVAGGYKYAMAGEGCCFLHCPPGYGPRPRDTGWYAEFGAITRSGSQAVPYGQDATRMAGATFDASGLYRLNAVFDWLEAEGLTVARMAEHAAALQRRFLELLAERPISALPAGALLRDPRREPCGRFLTFRLSTAAEHCAHLRAQNVITDVRRDRLRFGFGIYQDMGDVEHLIEVLRTL